MSLENSLTCTSLELIKKTLKILRKALGKREKIVYDEKEDDIEYLKDNIDELKGLKNSYFNKNKYHDYRAKYLGTDETIKYLFENDDEDYNIYEINYLMIRPELIKLITKNHEDELNANVVVGSKTSLVMSVMYLLKQNQLILMKHLIS